MGFHCKKSCTMVHGPPTQYGGTSNQPPFLLQLFPPPSNNTYSFSLSSCLALGTFTMYTCKQAVKTTIILMFIYMILMQACNTILKWDILTLLGLSLLAKIIIIFVADIHNKLPCTVNVSKISHKLLKLCFKIFNLEISVSRLLTLGFA